MNYIIDLRHTIGGISYTIALLKEECHKQNVPIVYCLQRRELAHILHRKDTISCVAILNYSGAEQLYLDLTAALRTAQTFHIEGLDFLDGKDMSVDRNLCDDDEFNQCFKVMSI